MRIVSDGELTGALSRFAGGGARLVAGGNFATPRHLLWLWDAAVPTYRLFMVNAQTVPPVREGVTHETPFVGPAMRRSGDRLDYLPMRLSLVPQLFAGSRPPDAVAVQTSSPRGGRVSLGIEVNVLRSAIEHTRARGGLVVAEVNPQMPYTLGDAELDVDLVDLAVEVDEPLPSPPVRPVGPVAQAIAGRVAPIVEDGATLQLGIGTIPDATLGALGARRDLAVWSEMISDGVLDLERRGALDTGREIVASFLFGSEDLYRWVDANPRVVMRRTETTNDPGEIARRPLMTSINTALEVDLFAQANASEVGGRIYSGFGGQTDFVVGALHSRGGHAVVALPAWHAPTDASTVVPRLRGPVTSFQHSVLVTEHGSAAIFGASRRSQVRHIIDGLAHPSARPGLWEAAGRLGLT